MQTFDVSPQKLERGQGVFSSAGLGENEISPMHMGLSMINDCEATFYHFLQANN